MRALVSVAVAAAAAAGASGTPPPPAGALFCGGVVGVLDTNLTVLADSRMRFATNIHAQGEDVLLSCDNEPFRYDPSTGVLNISADLANRSDCLAKGSKRDGGAHFTFVYDGAATITAANSHWGAVDLELAAAPSCDQSARMSARRRLDEALVVPPVGAVFCGGVPGIVASNLTILDKYHLSFNSVNSAAGMQLSCEREYFAFQPFTGVLDISVDLLNPLDCFTKYNVQHGGGVFAFTYDGDSTITAKNSKSGSVDLKRASGQC
eukprot:TRINITY_DN1988_c2_g1_i1.p1 TRINITY_DN1988_c2_g1~~TRINITY_DN1988_c2_g1_i1.p1  ORF type:complete len:264 (+),score=90.68 TRINITY_DN1988_c2_g1_i1:89-880(+)